MIARAAELALVWLLIILFSALSAWTFLGFIWWSLTGTISPHFALLAWLAGLLH